MVDTNASPDSHSGLNPDSAPELLRSPDILKEFLADVRQTGVAGEQRVAQLTYLSVTSRLLPWGTPTNRPVSMITRGTSASGKSHTTRSTLKFFPPEAYFDLGTASPLHLVYSDEPLAHRHLVVGEWAAIRDNEAFVASLRTLLSEGQLVHGTVDGNGRKEARRIIKDGPTGLLMTTTAAGVDPELETRCLSDRTDDTPAQTRRVYETLAEVDRNGIDAVIYQRWHDAQRWLAAHGVTSVEIPYLPALAGQMPTDAVRLRRDFVSLVCLIKAHAILHQCSRERNQAGEIVATLADYEHAVSLIDELISEEADRSVSEATRETVEAVTELLADSREFVSKKEIVDKLGIGRSSAYERINRALLRGYLVDTAPRDSRATKIVLGAEMPVGSRFLPAVAELREAFGYGAQSGQPEHNQTRMVEPQTEASPGSPGSPGQPLGDGVDNYRPASQQPELIAELERMMVEGGESV